MNQMLASRLIGFISSLILTLIAFSIIASPPLFHLDTKGAILVILNLAVLQAVIQSIFFLDLFGEKGMRWNLIIFLSTLTIIFIVIFFSIWIMDHLNYNMMMKSS